MKNCKEYKVDCEAVDCGNLSVDVETHIVRCAKCRTYVIELKEENALFLDVFSQPASEEAWNRTYKNFLEKQEEVETKQVKPQRRKKKRRSSRRIKKQASWHSAGIIVALVSSAAALILMAWMPKGGLFPQTPKTNQSDSVASASSLINLKEKIADERLLYHIGEAQYVFNETLKTSEANVVQDAELQLERILALQSLDGSEAQTILNNLLESEIQKRLHGIQAVITYSEPGEVLRNALRKTNEVFTEAELLMENQVAAAGPSEFAQEFINADRFYQMHEYKDALESYGIIAGQPGHPFAAMAQYSAAFILHKKLNRLEEARSAYHKFIAMHAASPLTASASFHAAEILENTGHFLQAAVAYENLLVRDNGRRLWIAERLDALLNQKEINEDDRPGWGSDYLAGYRLSNDDSVQSTALSTEFSGELSSVHIETEERQWMAALHQEATKANFPAAEPTGYYGYLARKKPDEGRDNPVRVFTKSEYLTKASVSTMPAVGLRAKREGIWTAKAKAKAEKEKALKAKAKAEAEKAKGNSGTNGNGKDNNPGVGNPDGNNGNNSGNGEANGNSKGNGKGNAGNNGNRGNGNGNGVGAGKGNSGKGNAGRGNSGGSNRGGGNAGGNRGGSSKGGSRGGGAGKGNGGGKKSAPSGGGKSSSGGKGKVSRGGGKAAGGGRGGRF